MALPSFSDWFFSKLPFIYKENDTYVDSNGEGLLERYLEIFGLEIDDGLQSQIDDYLDIVDPILCEPQYLRHISYTLGTPPDFFQNEAQYRILLATIVSIYKIKGTLKALQALAGLFGFTVNIIPILPDCTRYDKGVKVIYDDGLIYDTCCLPCKYYNLLWSQYPCIGPIPPPYTIGDINTPENIALMEAILCFLMPLHARLQSIQDTVFVCEFIGVRVLDQVMIQITDILLYDNSERYDATNDYDLGNTTTIYL
tara:strand:+ start:29412 stop:30176 length:765 start_codon:yes stop_codon:yes gene_type:complete